MIAVVVLGGVRSISALLPREVSNFTRTVETIPGRRAGVRDGRRAFAPLLLVGWPTALHTRRADRSAEQQCRIARLPRRAVLVITGETYSALALHDALDAVRHHKVADALVPRLAEAPVADDLATRALLEAVRLLPRERTVPALALALFLSERTLRRQLRVVCPLLTPRRTLSWACLLHAAWYLGET